MEDAEAWNKYPLLRDWFNKLHLALTMGYVAGPAGVAPINSGYYCVRPIYNLGGMGVGARKQWIDAGDRFSVEPGYFWCSWFEGDQYSTTYKRNDLNCSYEQISSYKADRGSELYKFEKWTRNHNPIAIHPNILNILLASTVTFCNVETIGDKIIEIHFRSSPDPDYNTLIPIWTDQEHLVDTYGTMGYTWIKNFDNSNGQLTNPRLGFMVK